MDEGEKHKNLCVNACKCDTQGVHSLSTVNTHVCAQKGYYLEQTCTKCTYMRHIAIKQ